jgi:LysM repeat protein
MVSYGDTPERIAARYGITLAQLMVVNGLSEGAILRPGEELLVPARFTASEHLVRDGETLSSIAQRYGIAPELLAQHNGLWTRDLVVVGQRLAIPVMVDTVVPRPERTIYVTTPLPGEAVGAWALVRGVATSPDNTLWIRAHGADGALLAEAWAAIHAEIGQQGAFSTVLSFPRPGAAEAITLTAQSHYLHDGGIREIVTLPLIRSRP